MWISDGPSEDYDTYGWSIGDVTNSWWVGMEMDMATTGNFARFKNGDTGDFISADPFTLTYSEVIDLSDVPAPHVEFEQYGARFFTVQAVEVSTDGGTSWMQVGNNSDIDELTNVGGAAFARPETRRYNLTTAIAGDPSNVMIRLFWAGAINGPAMNYIDYGWYVDNIRIVEGHAYDAKAESAYMQTGVGVSYDNGLEYYNIPLTQVAPINFSGIVSNEGGSTFTGLHLNTTVDKDGIVFTGTSSNISLASTESDSLATTVGFTPDEMGVYNVNFSFIGDDPDTYEPNNEIERNFEVTEYHYGRDNGIPTGAITNISGNSGNPFSIGNVMDIYGAGTIYSIDVVVTDAEENITSPIYGQLMIFNEGAGVWEYIDQTNDHEITEEENGGTVKLFFEDPINVDAGTLVLVLAGHYGVPDVGFRMAQNVDVGTVLGYTDAGLYSLANPGAIMIQLDFEEEEDEPVDPGDVGVEENISAFNVGQNMPNPFNNSTKIKYSLNNSAAVSIEIVDVTGKLIQTINKGIQTSGVYSVNINADELAEGIYFYSFTIGNEKVTKRMVVTK